MNILKKMMIFGVSLAILLVSLGGPIPVSAAANTWQWQTGTVWVRNLEAVWGTSPSNVFSVGFGGAILHYNGKLWSPMDSGSEAYLYSIWGSSANDVFAVGDYNTILHYDGNKWRTMISGGTGWLLDIWGSSESDVFAVGIEGTILHYDGSSWTSMTNKSSNFDLCGIWGSSAGNVFAVSDTGAILHYDGYEWNQMYYDNKSYFSDIWGISADNVFAVGYGKIMHFDGVSWTSMTEEYSNLYFYKLWGSSANNVYAAGDHCLLKYDDNQWSPVSLDCADISLTGVWGDSAADIFIVGKSTISEAGVTILHFNGKSWNSMLQDYNGKDLYDVWGSSPSNVYAIGYDNFLDSSVMLHYDGKLWSQTDCSYQSELIGIWGSSASDVFAVGYGGILHYDGVEWTLMKGDFSEIDIRSVWGTSASNIFAVGNQTILHYSGSKWVGMIDNYQSTEFNDVWGSSAKDVFVIGRDNYEEKSIILHYDGKIWKESLNAAHIDLYKIWGISAKNIYAVGYSYLLGESIILHYNGSNWAQLKVNLTDLYINSIWGSSSKDIYAVGFEGSTGKGVILHYNGGSWRSIYFGNIIEFSNIWGTSSSDIFVTGSNNVILHYGPFESVAPPEISTFVPETGSKGTSVVIKGINFTGASAVSFGGIKAASFKINSDTQITAKVGKGTTGKIKVTTPQGTAESVENFTFYDKPKIKSFNPRSGGEGTSIIITGSGFDGATGVSIGGTSVSDFKVESSTQISAIAGSGSTGRISVVTPGGTANSSSKFTYYLVPVISSFTPDKGGNKTLVTIKGNNLKGATAVSFGGIKAASYRVKSDTCITAKAGEGSTGPISIITPGGTTISSENYTWYPLPVISSFTPGSGGTGTEIIITGSGFEGAFEVKIGNKSAASFKIDSDTQITAVVGAGQTGKISIITPGGKATSKEKFKYIKAPGIK